MGNRESYHVQAYNPDTDKQASRKWLIYQRRDSSPICQTCTTGDMEFRAKVQGSLTSVIIIFDKRLLIKGKLMCFSHVTHTQKRKIF